MLPWETDKHLDASANKNDMDTGYTSCKRVNVGQTKQARWNNTALTVWNHDDNTTLMTYREH